MSENIICLYAKGEDGQPAGKAITIPFDQIMDDPGPVHMIEVTDPELKEHLLTA